MAIRIYLLILFCINVSAKAQQIDYYPIDSIARTKTYNGDLKLLVSQLTENCTTETEKARAVFIWITDNIAYDYKAFNKNKLPKRPKLKKGKNYGDIVAQWKIDYTDRVLRRGKAVCEGYAMLFKRMCDYAGLQTDMVSGYVKTGPGDVGRMGILDHAWNGIILNGNYYFVDVTWAAGTCPENKKGKLKDFTKKLDDFYWLTPTEKFCMDHYPADKTNPGVSNYPVETYKNNPYIKKNCLSSLTVFYPTSGVVEAHVGETITFTFEYDKDIHSIYLSSNTKRLKVLSLNNNDTEKYLSEESLKTPETLFKRNGNSYQFDYVVNNANTRYVEVYINFEFAMRFNIKIAR